MSLLRSLAQRHLLATRLGRSQQLNALTTTTSPRLSSIAPVTQHRQYATKGKGKAKSTQNIVPGSKQKITDEAAQQEYAKAETTMKNAVDWFKKECAGYETRASGRITPAILSPVRVKLGSDPKDYRLEELATVGVREGSTLLITLFDEHNMKHIESALHTCGIPGVVPHRQDNRTIKVPIPKPTVESRLSLYAAAKKKAEEIRVQVRRQHSTSLKRGKFEKHSIEIEEFQKLTDRYIGEVDKILKDLQKATGGK
ncbi:hypothetical protein CC1G_06350 [Coprinopsis cinerea okayama7|uniref:Ribosome recycling factor domain-containing protein n=1 Tax=Coprinopsis cinerea (strain Okayama-7 / 130 / ATCC MYA-4618 / FGSC 9003) TaxID=240176 RepID=A8NTM1_COPC7|nr:hypothetical protein CC1G_06350 [Coprinopsis cinerea okayama7\|eukprot:XP_001836265.2 hypothetical protein CC1G_06350 [Coprinopsis cinerea okayama7\